MKFLKRIREDKAYIKDVAEIIQDHFYETIFKPLFDILGVKPIALNNSSATDFKPIADAVIQAITSGRIWYEDGGFAGTFNAAVTKGLKTLGAVYANKKFKISQDKIPFDIKAVINSVKVREANKAKSAIDYVDSLKGTANIDFKDLVLKITGDLEDKIVYTMPKDITIPMEMTKYTQERIAENYTENMNLYIQKWKEEEIVKLRGKVQENVSAGFRSSKLAEDIQRQYGVSKRKAHFLASQETSLLTAKYNQTRYADAGLKKYRWRTMGDKFVRHDPHGPNHKHLNGRVFSFDNPPIVDLATGRRANPGEDFGPCRCWAEVLIG